MSDLEDGQINSQPQVFLRHGDMKCLADIALRFKTPEAIKLRLLDFIHDRLRQLFQSVVSRAVDLERRLLPP